MKHKHSISQAYIQRDKVILPLLFRKALRITSWPTKKINLCHIVANLPTQQFFITEDAAVGYIRKRYLHGVKKKFRSVYKQRLFDAFYEEFLAIKQNSSASIQACCLAALNKEAPCIGLTPAVILIKLTQIK